MEMKNVFTKKNPQKIIFKDALLEITLGQWFGILHDSVASRIPGMGIIYSHLDGKRLLGNPIPKEQKEEIQKKAREMFDTFGFQNESIVLKNFVSHENEFDILLKDKNQTYKGCFRFGDMIDFAPEFILSSENFKKVYEYWSSKNSYTLSSYELKNNEKGNMVSRYCSPYRYNVTFNNESYQGSISFAYPEHISDEFGLMNENPYVNVKELDEFLIDLDYPVRALDIYHKLLSEINIPKEKLDINVSIHSKTDIPFQEEISTEEGIVQSISVTRNQRIMSWSDNGWSLRSGNFSVSKNANGKYSYSSDNLSEKDLMYSLSQKDEIEMVEQEVFKTKEEVKKRLLLK